MKINEEFKSLIPPLSKSEFDLLEKSILDEGCRDSLVTWNGVLIDGHNRYEICQKHKIKFNTVEKKFEDENAVKLWILDNQIGRRNLNSYQRAELILKMKEEISRQAKLNQKQSKGRGKKGLSNLTNVNTRNILADKADVSSGTLYKVEKIIKNIDDKIKAKLENGEYSISEVYNRMVKYKDKGNITSVVVKNPLPNQIIKKVKNIFEKLNDDFDSVELSLTKKNEEWDISGFVKILKEKTMKYRLQRFIQKYHLNGMIESTMWVVEKDYIKTNFRSADKSFMGLLTMKDFYSQIESGSKFGILTTAKLLRLLKLMREDLELSVTKVDTPDGDKIISLKLDDGEKLSNFMLADISVIPKAKGLKAEPTYNLYFSLDTQFCESFIKSRKALPDTLSFTIVKEDGKYNICIGYSSTNGDSVSYEIKPYKVVNTKEKDRPISFSINYFQNILNTNLHGQIDFIVSYQGISQINVIDDDIEATYFLAEVQTDV